MEGKPTKEKIFNIADNSQEVRMVLDQYDEGKLT